MCVLHFGQIDSPQHRSMKTTRDCDLTYLSYESRVLMEGITFGEFLVHGAQNQGSLEINLFVWFYDFLVKNRHCLQ